MLIYLKVIQSGLALIVAAIYLFYGQQVCFHQLVEGWLLFSYLAIGLENAHFLCALSPSPLLSIKIFIASLLSVMGCILFILNFRLSAQDTPFNHSLLHEAFVWTQRVLALSSLAAGAIAGLVMLTICALSYCRRINFQANYPSQDYDGLIQGRQFPLEAYEGPVQSCSICLGEVGPEGKALGVCRHVYHESCITQWLARKPECPYCKAQVRFS